MTERPPAESSFARLEEKFLCHSTTGHRSQDSASCVPSLAEP
jgi:hypothetical protein